MTPGGGSGRETGSRADAGFGLGGEGGDDGRRVGWDRDIGALAAAGKGASTYGRLGVGEEVGKACLAADTDAGRASGTVDRWWMGDERHES